MRPQVHVITLGVADLDASLAFYRDGLGWEPFSVHPGEVAFFDVGGMVLGLYTGLAGDAGLAAEAVRPGGVALAHNVADRGDVDAVIAELVAAGAQVTRPPHDADWGGRSGYVADPDGHLWEVAWNPGWPLDDDGRLLVPPT